MVTGEVEKDSGTMVGIEGWVHASSDCPNVSEGTVVGLYGVVCSSKPWNGVNEAVGTHCRS